MALLLRRTTSDLRHTRNTSLQRRYRHLTSRAASVYVYGAAGGVREQQDRVLVYVPPHPLIQHWLAIARNASTPPPLFRNAMAELGRCLVYEACREWLPTVELDVETPCGTARCNVVDPAQPVSVVPILRAGLVLVEQCQTVLPAASTYHVGYMRNEETLEPALYLNKLPESFQPGAHVLIADPMLATGGSMVAALDLLISRGAAPCNMRVVCAVAASSALQRLSGRYKGLRIYVGCIDETLNDSGFIVPGLGDAGDRAYGTS